MPTKTWTQIPSATLYLSAISYDTMCLENITQGSYSITCSTLHMYQFAYCFLYSTHELQYDAFLFIYIFKYNMGVE